MFFGFVSMGWCYRFINLRSGFIIIRTTINFDSISVVEICLEINSDSDYTITCNV